MISTEIFKIKTKIAIITSEGSKAKQFFFFYYYLHFYPPITRKRRSAIRARLGVAGHLSATLGWGNPVKCLSQRHNK